MDETGYPACIVERSDERVCLKGGSCMFNSKVSIDGEIVLNKDSKDIPAKVLERIRNAFGQTGIYQNVLGFHDARIFHESIASGALISLLPFTVSGTIRFVDTDSIWRVVFDKEKHHWIRESGYVDYKDAMQFC